MKLGTMKLAAAIWLLLNGASLPAAAGDWQLEAELDGMRDEIFHQGMMTRYEMLHQQMEMERWLAEKDHIRAQIAPAETGGGFNGHEAANNPTMKTWDAWAGYKTR